LANCALLEGQGGLIPQASVSPQPGSPLIRGTYSLAASRRPWTSSASGLAAGARAVPPPPV